MEIMESSSATSHEKLERMLADGKISQADYVRLSKAMAPSLKEADLSDSAEAKPRKILKCWETGQIGGICAGFAAYFGIDVRIVRVIVILAFLFLLAWDGLGLLLIPLYFALCSATPWDEPEKARAFKESGWPKTLMISAAVLFVILPALYSMLVLPSLESACERMGIRVWSVEFQGTLPGRAFDAASEYGSLLSQVFSSPSDHVLIFFLVLAVAAISILFLGVVYSHLCKASIRRILMVLIIGSGAAWFLFLLGGTLYPLLTRAA